jgi:hypothetical protein
MIDHNQHIAKAIALKQVCQVVKAIYAPRYGLNMKRVKSRSHLWLNLGSSTHDASLTKVFHILANSFALKSVERFGKSACDSCLTS